MEIRNNYCSNVTETHCPFCSTIEELVYHPLFLCPKIKKIEFNEKGSLIGNPHDWNIKSVELKD